MDCIVGDFLNGAGEELVRQHQNHDIMLIEGQGMETKRLFLEVARQDGLRAAIDWRDKRMLDRSS